MKLIWSTKQKNNTNLVTKHGQMIIYSEKVERKDRNTTTTAAAAE